MNRNNLQVILKKYLDNFEILNNSTNDETYKWEIAYEFQKFDIDAPDFAGMLGQMLKVSSNLIDSAQQLPFTALVDYAHKEPETVREMFRKLYNDEFIENEAKQKLIDEFIKETGYTFPVYYDTEYSAAMAYSINSIPVTVFVDKDGNVQYSRIGAMTENMIRTGIEMILN